MVKILIVEDDANIAKTIEVTVSMVGYGCQICGNGEDAVREALENDYDLILLDVMLPGLDGFQVIEKIKERKIPVVFFSSFFDQMYCNGKNVLMSLLV